MRYKQVVLLKIFLSLVETGPNKIKSKQKICLQSFFSNSKNYVCNDWHAEATGKAVFNAMLHISSISVHKSTQKSTMYGLGRTGN